MITAPYVAIASKSRLSASPKVAGVAEWLERECGLPTLFEGPSLRFLGDEASQYLLPDKDSGIIWGPLFDRRSSIFQVRAGDAELRSPLRRFIAQFWGGYVAFRVRPDGVEVFRDPSGMTPCYLVETDDAYLFTSRPMLLVQLGLVAAQLDWTIVAQALAYRDLRPARTAVRGVTELLPGMCIRICPEGAGPECIWSPWDFASADLEITSYAEAARAVREAVLQAARSWARITSNPIVELSGGLDSSIVAAALSSAGATPLCVTFIPSAGDSDERDYARATADHLGLSLKEIELSLDAVDVTRSDAADLPRPCARNFAQALDRPLRRISEANHADMFFSGGGGDNVFCHLQSALPVVDLIKRCGLGRRVGRATMDVAEIADVTFWEALRSVAKRKRERDRVLPKPQSNRFLSRDALNALPWPADNPWLKASPGTLPGKRRHIWGLVSILNHLEGFGRQAHAPICSPLLSQPVLETCLRVPTWLWFEHGMNRSVAREAFRDLLPTTVVRRRTKAAFDSLGAQIIRRNADALQAMLLDGVLVHEGIADRAFIESALRRPMADGEAVAELLGLADVEAWARVWSASSARTWSSASSGRAGAAYRPR